MSGIKVSIISPIYNNSQYVKELIHSLMNQSLAEIEIICVDDGSPDKSSIEYIKRCAHSDDRIRIIEQENHGAGYAINRGIDAARGDYIAEVDSDDSVLPQMYEYLYSISDECDIVKSGIIFDGGIRTAEMSITTEDTGIFCPRELYFTDRLKWFSFQPSMWSGIYRRDYIERNGIRMSETEGGAFQDTSMIFELNARAETAKATAKNFYRWRVDNSASATKSKKYPLALLKEYERMEKLLEDNPEYKYRLRTILSRLRFGSYSWNAERLGDDAEEFIIRAAEDLRRDWPYQDSRFYTEEEWISLQRWMTK